MACVLPSPPHPLHGILEKDFNSMRFAQSTASSFVPSYFSIQGCTGSALPQRSGIPAPRRKEGLTASAWRRETKEKITPVPTWQCKVASSSREGEHEVPTGEEHPLCTQAASELGGAVAQLQQGHQLTPTCFLGSSASYSKHSVNASATPELLLPLLTVF